MGLGLEVLFLLSLATNPRFQNYVRAVEAHPGRREEAVSAEETAKRILGALPARLVERFEQLKARCAELRQIALDLKEPHDGRGAPPLDELHLEGLDRLLWIYLRLLFTQHSLERFLEKTGERQIRDDIAGQEKRLEALPPGDAPQRQQMRKALEDNLETSRARLANFLKAKENYELVNLEVERLDNKSRSLSELAVNRHEPQFISGQIDQVATSVVQTERTIADLQFVTGLTASDQEVPEILRRRALQAGQ